MAKDEQAEIKKEIEKLTKQISEMSVQLYELQKKLEGKGVKLRDFEPVGKGVRTIHRTMKKLKDAAAS